MKDLKISKKSKFLEFLTGKGFYLFLAVALTLAGSTIWFAMNRSIDNVIDKNINLMKNSVSSEENLKPVDNIVDNVPIKNKEYALGKRKKNTKQVKENKQQVKNVESEKNEEANVNEPDVERELDKQVLFVPPLAGEVVGNFSNNELVINRTLKDWRTHNGIDVKASQGSQVKAIADGTVTKIYDDPIWGMCIEIEHVGNITSKYCGLNKKVNVNEGDKIEADNVIGSVGDTAICESDIGPHLHLEVIENGVKIDPLSKIKM